MIKGILIAIGSGLAFMVVTGKPLLGAGLGVAFGIFFGWLDQQPRAKGPGSAQDGSGPGGNWSGESGGSDSWGGDSGGGDSGGGS